MTLTIHLMPTEEAQMRQMALTRGEDLAHFAANALRIGMAALAAEDRGSEGALDPAAEK